MPREPLLPPPPESEHDRALRAGLRRADASAFDALYETYFSRIYRYFARRLETVAETERATEAAFTAVFQGVSSAPSEVPLQRWIFRRVRQVESSLERPMARAQAERKLKIRPRGGSIRSG